MENPPSGGASLTSVNQRSATIHQISEAADLRAAKTIARTQVDLLHDLASKNLAIAEEMQKVIDEDPEINLVLGYWRQRIIESVTSVVKVNP